MNNWPVWEFDPQNKTLMSESESEYRKTCVVYEAKLIAGEVPIGNKSECIKLDTPFGINIARFSSMTRLLRVTVLVQKFISKLKKHRIGLIEASEIESAESRWIRYIQNKHFGDIFESIRSNRTNNLKNQLDLYLDEHGLLRCGGRLENADISEAARHPLLLPKNDKFTDLIIESYHKKAMHVGVAQTLGLLRHRYWIPHGRTAVRKILRSCATCRRHEGGPYKMPSMPPLPNKRVSETVPFTYTGVDYFGPLFIKTKAESQKVWVCLFTCLVTRAVHLELIQNMSTEQFILGFRRFLSRHGKPREIVSDNASQFKLASETFDRLWEQVLSQNDVLSYAANEGIKWKFIVELAPWMGGFYERLVGLVKRTLKKAIGKASLTNEQLLTLLKEAEAVINARPLVYIGDDIQSHIALTPAHFLTLNPNIGIPDIDTSEDDDYTPNKNAAEKLLETWKKGHKLLDRFWQIWRNDYLLSLRERTQTKLKEARVRFPLLAKVGDVVLIKDELPRGSWRMGKIQELVQSGDLQIRSAKVLLPSGKMLGRPLKLLYPIECPESDISSEEHKKTDSEKLAEPDKQDIKRPKRQAAIRALDKIKSNLTDK